MKKLISLLITLFSIFITYAQNVGIGTTTPGFPLNFANTTGDKISLYGNSGNHFGFGIQSSLLQIHTDAVASNIAFGYGSSSSFTERMRILNNGSYDGMSLNGRLVLKNGSTDLVAGGAGVWMYKADNSALLGFMGAQNNQNIGFFGGPSGWGFTYDAINSRVGIGNTAPVNRLDIGGLNNWDLTNTEGDMRVGNSNYRIKFGVALNGGGAGASSIMQYGQAGGFNNLSLGSQGKSFININGGSNYVDLTNLSGGLRVNGNAGSAGQVLQSNGNSASPSWTNSSKPYILFYEQTGNVQVQGPSSTISTPVPGLDNIFFTLQQPCSIIYNASLPVQSMDITTSYCSIIIRIYDINNLVVKESEAYSQALFNWPSTITAMLAVNLPAGAYRTEFLLHKFRDTGGSSKNYGWGGRAIIQVIPN